MSVRGMDTAKETESVPKATRRHLLLGTAGAVLIAAVGGGYYLWSRPQSSSLPSAAPDASVSMAELMLPGPLGDEIMGSPNAPVVIVEYASMTCPHCAHFHETTFPEMKKRYIDTGKVRFIFREFPLDPLATAGSVLARCAGKDKYFPMLETLFAHQKEWVVQKPLEPLLAIARQAGFTQQSFDQCLSNQQLVEGVEASRARGTKLGVSSTPTFFINGTIVRGALSVEELDKQVAPFLKSS
jgi:protein-disulfide isomerase